MAGKSCGERCAAMGLNFGQLRLKEVIGIEDGSRFGYVGDMELDLDSGQIRSLIIHGRLRLFGLLGREKDVVIPWETVRRFGEDTILVDGLRINMEERKTRHT